MNDEIQEEDATLKTRSFGGYFLWPVLILVLYVLSIGPFFMMREKHVFKDATSDLILMTFYRPLVWADKRTPLRKPLDSYVNLWKEK